MIICPIRKSSFEGQNRGEVDDVDDAIELHALRKEEEEATRRDAT